MTLLLTHPAFLSHETPPGHPERPDRLRAILAALEEPRFAGLARREAAQADPSVARLAHEPRHVDAIVEQSPSEGLVPLDPDTVMSPGSLEAALRALGGAVEAVDQVMSGAQKNAFLAARPPGHHAERQRAMGFCLFNTVAVAARHAMRKHGAKRVAIFDWDVHHGNGTQDIFWDDPAVLFVSTHQMPLYPGSGDPSETGAHDNIVNVALKAQDDGKAFRAAFEARVAPRLLAHEADLILISAGFDAHFQDPLGGLRLTADDFAWATRRMMEIAAGKAGGRIVSVLEGGYDLEGLSSSVAAHLDALMTA
jgi:acetoin utilization deacetylase AcuC-like enzyme